MWRGTTSRLVPGSWSGLRDPTAGGHPRNSHGGAVEVGARRVGSTEAFGWPHGTGTNGEPMDFSIVPEPGTPERAVLSLGFGETGRYEIVRPRRSRNAGGMGRIYLAVSVVMAGVWSDPGLAMVGGAITTSDWNQTRATPLQVSRSRCHGSALTLQPGETRTLWLSATILDGSTR